jgi:hypothetical protein
MRRLGVEHFKIILIKLYPCASNEELEAEEFNGILKYDKSILLNENLVFKKRSENHVKKVADANRGDKSVMWKYGSVFKRTGKSRDGYCVDSWCFVYHEYIDETFGQKADGQYYTSHIPDILHPCIAAILHLHNMGNVKDPVYGINQCGNRNCEPEMNKKLSCFFHREF